MADVVEVLVAGGKATPGPPLGPSLGPLGVNIVEVVAQINEQTKEFDGVQVPVKVIIDDKKQVTIEVGTPPTSALILQELGIEKGISEGSEPVGDITIDQIKKIAKMKKGDLLSYSLANMVKEILGTCNSLGVTAEGMDPKVLQKEIGEGAFIIEEE